MSLTLMELAINPEIQERLREEVNDVLAKRDGKFDYDSIFEMNYLNQVFNGMRSSSLFINRSKYSTYF